MYKTERNFSTQPDKTLLYKLPDYQSSTFTTAVIHVIQNKPIKCYKLNPEYKYEEMNTGTNMKEHGEQSRWEIPGKPSWDFYLKRAKFGPLKLEKLRRREWEAKCVQRRWMNGYGLWACNALLYIAPWDRARKQGHSFISKVFSTVNNWERKSQRPRNGKKILYHSYLIPSHSLARG